MVCPKDIGGAPPHKNNLNWKKLGFKPSGLKVDTTLWLTLFPPHSPTCSLADDPEASAALDPHLNIGLRRQTS